MEKDKDQDAEKPTLSNETIIEEINKCKNNPKYEMQVALALENGGPVAQEFLRRAREIDPFFVETSCFCNIFLEE